LAWSVETARLAREHNNAQVVSVGARMHSYEEVHQFVEVFVRTAYLDEGRHNRRLKMILNYEDTGEVPVSGGGG
jgi:ribose 5-phosphate isomerase B